MSYQYAPCFSKMVLGFVTSMVRSCTSHAVANRINRLGVYSDGLFRTIRSYLAHIEPHIEPHFLTCLLLLAFSIPATAQNTSVSLPFDTSRSLLLVSVTIDGQSKTLIFDTGAERTLIQDSRNVEHRATLILGNKTLSNFPVALVSLTGMGIEKVHADGVLGQDVIGRFSCIRINFQTRQIEMVQ